MKKKLSNIVIILIFVAGLSLLVYPFVANKWNSYRQDRLISNYEKIVSQKSDSIDYDAEMKKAKAYNDALAPHILPDSLHIGGCQVQHCLLIWIKLKRETTF